ncbi:MAG: addiction module protein [Bacteroidales bacterium]|nr:addiction module protein [Bacteroidales bacterium]
MELTISVKEKQKADFLIKLLQELNFVEIIDFKEDDDIYPDEHKRIIQERLEKIAKGETTFKSWNDIKKKYEHKAI